MMRQRVAQPWPLVEAEMIRKAFAPQPNLRRQRADLRRRLAALSPGDRFAPGHLVAEKPGLRAAGTGDRALIYLRALNIERWQDREIVRSAIRDGNAVGGVPDCLVGCCDGDAFLELPCASARLRLLEPEEIAEVEVEIEEDPDDAG